MDSPSIIMEAFLHYVWKTRQFDHHDLFLTDGRKLKIQDYGHHNHDAGPDFSNARITLDNILWAGNIEMHTVSSMWNKHKHNMDPAYDNVILHVVHENDMDIFRKSGDIIPTLELKNRINPKISSNYHKLLDDSNWIPCEKLIHNVDAFRIKLWLEKIAIERLERKTGTISELLDQTSNDWEQTCFVLLSRYLGAKVNVLPMELLAKNIDIKLLYKNSDNKRALEAILFGVSGLLNSSFKDDYPNLLKTEFEFYKKKYGLNTLNPVGWKFARMRPSNFPTLRIAQLAALLFNRRFLFRAFIEAQNIKDIYKLLGAKSYEYWDTHYRFDEESKMREKKLGNMSMNLIVINVIVPLMFVYGQHLSDESIKDKALKFLQDIPAELNSITKKWMSLEIPNENALYSQSLIQLKHEYCENKRCLECAIGNEIIRL